VRDRRPCRPGSGALLGALLAAGALACAGAPPQAVEARPPAEPSAPAPPARETQPEPQREPEPERSAASAVVVDPGGGAAAGGRGSLVEAARAERERRAQTGRPVAVITDKNVREYASKGQITIVAPDGRERVGEQAEAASGEEGEAARDERYWRERGLEIRVRWREAAQESEELETQAAELRQRFYAEDDPYIRDGQIKPEWDRTLDRLQQARLEADLAQQDLASFLEDGRRSGALPGWLSEGLDLEPKAPEAPSARRPTGDAIEPPILQEERDGDGDGDGA
jgi:hypothetical protein